MSRGRRSGLVHQKISYYNRARGTVGAAGGGGRGAHYARGARFPVSRPSVVVARARAHGRSLEHVRRKYEFVERQRRYTTRRAVLTEGRR